MQEKKDPRRPKLSATVCSALLMSLAQPKGAGITRVDTGVAETQDTPANLCCSPLESLSGVSASRGLDPNRHKEPKHLLFGQDGHRKE